MKVLRSVWLAAAGGVAFDCAEAEVPPTPSPVPGDEAAAAVEPIPADPPLPLAADFTRTPPAGTGWSLVPAVPPGDLEVLGDGTGPVPWLASLDELYRRVVDVWAPVALPDAGHPYAVWGASPEDVWAVGRDGRAWHWADGRWHESDTRTDRALHAVWGGTAREVWAAGDGGTLLRFDGEDWFRVLAPTDRTLRVVHGTAPDDVWAAGDGGTLLHWNGCRWTAFDSGTDRGLRGLWCAARDDAWAVGAEGTILHWDGHGWSAVESGTTASLAAVAGRGSCEAWAVGAEGTILRWDGARWAEEPSPCPPTRSFFDVSVSESGDVWAVGSCRLLRRER
ncbi:MAG: hypothetical protein JXB32_02990 [Deltaproteobacteria bacterium]|nr:hypothetical protein [Deltaproteobacteria bacterium]